VSTQTSARGGRKTGNANGKSAMRRPKPLSSRRSGLFGALAAMSACNPFPSQDSSKTPDPHLEYAPDIGAGSDPDNMEVAEAIDLDRYKEMVTTLASDEFEGRGYGESGGVKTIEYIAGKFEEAGLTPGRHGSYRMPFTRARENGANVIGTLLGNDPFLKDSYIVVGGHHDAYGKDDCVYYGANDNATGAAAVIELAFAFAELRSRLKRTLIFITFDGEEQGYYGSEYYVRNPPYPLSATALMMNFDSLGRQGVYVSRTTRRREPCFDSDSDVFDEHDVPIEYWCTPDDEETIHECTDTADLINWQSAASILLHAGASLYEAAQR
jgi:hypothetical protein